MAPPPPPPNSSISSSSASSSRRRRRSSSGGGGGGGGRRRRRIRAQNMGATDQRVDHQLAAEPNQYGVISKSGDHTTVPVPGDASAAAAAAAAAAADDDDPMRKPRECNRGDHHHHHHPRRLQMIQGPCTATDHRDRDRDQQQQQIITPIVRVVRVFAPKTVTTDASSFREVVQKLTGFASGDDDHDDLLHGAADSDVISHCTYTANHCMPPSVTSPSPSPPSPSPSPPPSSSSPPPPPPPPSSSSSASPPSPSVPSSVTPSSSISSVTSSPSPSLSSPPSSSSTTTPSSSSSSTTTASSSSSSSTTTTTTTTSSPSSSSSSSSSSTSSSSSSAPIRSSILDRTADHDRGGGALLYVVPHIDRTHRSGTAIDADRIDKPSVGGRDLQIDDRDQEYSDLIIGADQYRRGRSQQHRADHPHRHPDHAPAHQYPAALDHPLRSSSDQYSTSTVLSLALSPSPYLPSSSSSPSSSPSSPYLPSSSSSSSSSSSTTLPQKLQYSPTAAASTPQLLNPGLRQDQIDLHHHLSITSNPNLVIRSCWPFTPPLHDMIPIDRAPDPNHIAIPIYRAPDPNHIAADPIWTASTIILSSASSSSPPSIDSLEYSVVSTGPCFDPNTANADQCNNDSCELLPPILLLPEYTSANCIHNHAHYADHELYNYMARSLDLQYIAPAHCTIDKPQCNYTNRRPNMNIFDDSELEASAHFNHDFDAMLSSIM